MSFQPDFCNHSESFKKLVEMRLPPFIDDNDDAEIDSSLEDKGYSMLINRVLPFYVMSEAGQQKWCTQQASTK
ncbi:hypothetical protein L6164_012261 [Bauhinia variegata]|uniref:Uncharacterized protein n=1 Tax=Bauhinia variegata TaxID=167791 RepID=A0ACB9P8L7_BAUVA|nr:hypothetical protein L6164_012261 [Bauhinia variegata]